ncbi:MAG: hypothetical protein JSS86_04435 [Cyanobacteria bacterium SZAS LIN-2]|nr:hypothetical protein [Cyanobacteria bacterium SZAS LIN-2]
MLIVLAFILVLLASGGGIYLWVKRQRKLLLKKKMDLAASSETLDTGAPSVLDSVTSPVISPTTSSAAGDRPQINAPASGGTDGGKNGSTDGGTTTATTEPAPVVDSKFGARFRQAAPTIKELAEKLMSAWNDASVAHNACESARYQKGRQDSTIVISIDPRFVAEKADLDVFVEEANLHFAGIITNVKSWYDFSRLVTPTAQAASAAFEALRVALKPYPKHHVEYLPADMQALCLSAHNLLEVSKSSIERLLTEAQISALNVEKVENEDQPLKRVVIDKLFVSDAKTFAEGTHKDDQDEVFEARAALKAAMVKSIEVLRQSQARFNELEDIFRTLAEFEEKTFVFPQKPTPEEILRFLTDLENWAGEKLTAQRRVEELMAAARNASKNTSDALKALQRSRGRTSPVLNDARRVIDEALILTANNVVTSIETAIAQFNKSQMEAGLKLPKVTAPVTNPQPEEEAQIKLLRGLERTVAFALAQQTVASAKLALVQQNEPCGKARAPRVERSESFAKYLSQNEAFLKQQQVETAEYDKWAEGRDLVQMAFEARKAKLAETSGALSSKLAEVLKTVTATPADELLVVNSVAAKMVQLTGS